MPSVQYQVWFPIHLHMQEVDNWSTLSSDVDEVFASQDVSRIAAKLAGMKQSLVS